LDAGVEVLKKLQKEYCNDDSKEIIMISKDNFLLFTPMLPEVATGTVDTRHIVINQSYLWIEVKILTKLKFMWLYRVFCAHH